MSKVKTVPKLCLDLDCSRGELKSNNLQLLVQRCLKSKQYQSYAWTWIRPGVSWFGLVWNPFLLTQLRSTRFQSSSGRSAHLLQMVALSRFLSTFLRFCDFSRFQSSSGSSARLLQMVALSRFFSNFAIFPVFKAPRGAVLV